MAGKIKVCQRCPSVLQNIYSIPPSALQHDCSKIRLWQVYDTGPRDATGSPLVCLPPIGRHRMASQLIICILNLRVFLFSWYSRRLLQAVSCLECARIQVHVIGV